ncbi:hypothetical protein NIES4071_84780 [Calothrix sp. NIES-4071]|nr:hypothetical protein NIES4071_84780 [Calothrix sp. NIES-4071]BAZ62745.1 hypothetical protein NIES4105_84710 [Calothrix sp. NIES-4105]
MFEGNKDFEEISAQLLAERELDFDRDDATSAFGC